MKGQGMDLTHVAAVIEAVPMPLLLIDADKRIVAANGAARAMFGAEVLERHFALALRQPGPLAAVEAALAEGRASMVQHVQTGVTQETVFRLHVRPVEAPEGRGALASFEDVTEAEAIGRFRRDFVANVSHELRTPLTALMGFIETLRGPARDDAAARERFLAVMAAEAERMSRLVRDLLHLSRVEAEERVRPTARLDLATVLAGAAEALAPVAEAAGVTLRREGEAGPVWVAGDADQLTQVFQNLIENAVKYGGGGGGVTLRIRRIERDPGLRCAAIAVDVADTGAGIAPEHVPRLTERFYRVDQHRSRTEGGTGLGLAIVKHIAQRHRGRLAIASTPGKGSCFSVILPAV